MTDSGAARYVGKARVENKAQTVDAMADRVARIANEALHSGLSDPADVNRWLDVLAAVGRRPRNGKGTAQ